MDISASAGLKKIVGLLEEDGVDELEVDVGVTVTFTLPQLVMLPPDEHTLKIAFPAATPETVRIDPLTLLVTMPVFELLET